MRTRRTLTLVLGGIAAAAAALTTMAIIGQGAQPEAQPASLGTILRGIEHREQAVESATGVMALEVVASAAYVAAEQAKQQKACDGIGWDVHVHCEPRDVTALRFSYGEDSMAWQACPLTDSGMDWWGLGSRYGPQRSDSFRLDDLRCVGYCQGETVYAWDATSTACLVTRFNPNAYPPEPLRKFLGFVVSGWSRPSVEMWRTDADFRVVGTGLLDGEECLVVGAAIRHPPPSGFRRFWVCPSEGFIILRMEQVEVGANGQISSAALTTASDVQEYPGPAWLPQTVRTDHWGWTGQIEHDFTKRFYLAELSVNEGFEWGPADWLFPLSRTWMDDREATTCLWDGGQSLVDALATRMPLGPAPRFGEAVLANAADLRSWVFRAPEGDL
jgi:hypothetical protein